MASNTFPAELQDFEGQLNQFYINFHRSKKVLLEGAPNKSLQMENERLKEELAASKREHGYLQQDVTELKSKVANLEEELGRKNDLLKVIGQFVNPTVNVNRKRERSLTPDTERKRPREIAPQHSSPAKQNNRHGHDVPRSDHPAFGLTPSASSSSGPSSDAKASQFRAAQQTSPTAEPVSQVSRIAHGNRPPPPPPPPPRSEMMGLADYHESPPSHPNGRQHWRPRRLVCHACYANRENCDNGIECQNCQLKGVSCVRSLCAKFKTYGKCVRPQGDCFKIHGEQGYNTVEFDPFAGGSGKH